MLWNKNAILRKANTFLTQSICYSSTWQEIKIPVPWGHISGKWWGPQDKRPILTSHGWQDNSGSFDTIIPLLPKATSFLAIDFPGCGYSSQFPPGTFLHPMDLVIILRRIVQHFEWSKVSLLGHSMGAGTGYAYAMLYPHEVDFLICLDMLKPVVEDKPICEIANNIDYFIKFDNINNMNKVPHSYSMQEMEQRLHKSLNSVALDKCKYILQRNTKPSTLDPNTFYFTIDPRLKIYSVLDISQESLLQNSDRLKCPICYLKSSKGPYFEKKEYVFDVIDAIKKHNKNVEVHFVNGEHHLHLNNPESCANILNNFLEKYDVGDRSNGGLKPETLVI